MAVHANVQESVQAGTPAFVPSESPTEDFGVVFEDDGRTGYFYALRLSSKGQSIVDALQIYDVHEVPDAHRSSLIAIAWSADGKSAMLLIDSSPHAVFDFQAKRGYCRSGFPPSSIGKSLPESGHAWSDPVLRHFSSET